MKKIIYSFMAVMTLAVMSFTASAYSFMVNGLAYNINSNGTSVTLTYEKIGAADSTKAHYTDLRGDVVIPSTVVYNNKYYTVTAIGDYALCHCQEITSLSIPKTVKSIGRDAMYYDKALETITLAEGSELASISDYAIYTCEKLLSFNLEVTTKLTYLGVRCISRNYKLQGTIDLSHNTSLTAIGPEAFYQDWKVTAFLLPESITTISYGAFAGTKAIEEFTIPSKLTVLEDAVFGGCINLKHFNIHNNIKRIGNSTFSTAGTNWKDISLTIPNSVEYIGASCFSSSGLKSVVIPSSVKYIDDGVFKQCQHLTDVTIHNKTIGEEQFYGCDSLASINLCEVDTIKRWAFGYSGLISVTIPSNVKDITWDAFAYCKLLTSVNIQNNTIAPKQFLNCSALTNVTMGNNVTNIEDGAFQNCTALKKITIPSNVTTLSTTSFAGCTGINTLQICSNVAANGVYFPDLKSSLQTLTLYSPVTALPENAFKDFSEMTLLTLPSTLTSIGNSAFQGCSALMNIHALMPRPFAIDASVFDGVQAHGYCDLHVIPGSKVRYSAMEVWKEFTIIAEDAIDPGQPDTGGEPGDVNGDGTIDVSDMNSVINVLLGQETNSGADVNGDGIIDIDDMNLVINYMLGN